MNRETIQKLEWGPTWKLLVFAFLTLGVYLAHYAARQTKVLNSYLPEKGKIKEWLIDLIFIITYLSFTLLISPFVFLAISPETIELMDKISESTAVLIFIINLFWIFVFRAKWNHYFSEPNRKAPLWFHWFWTGFFAHYYLNYKVNTLLEEQSPTVLAEA